MKGCLFYQVMSSNAVEEHSRQPFASVEELLRPMRPVTIHKKIRAIIAAKPTELALGPL